MRERHLMKTITTTQSVRKTDSSLDATLNAVELPSKEIVSWAIAFPRPELTRPELRSVRR
jgi:hypothetical protein